MCSDDKSCKYFVRLLCILKFLFPVLYDCSVTSLLTFILFRPSDCNDVFGTVDLFSVDTLCMNFLKKIVAFLSYFML